MRRIYPAAILLCGLIFLFCGCQAPSDGSDGSDAPPAAPPAVSQQTVPADPPPSQPDPPPPTDPVPVSPPASSLPDPAPQPTAPVPAAKNTKLYVLMYHHVVPDGTDCNNWTITEGRLREDLLWLRDNGYTCVLPRELSAGMSLPEKAVMITFDDGYASNYHLAFPLLRETQSKAVISLITKRTEDGDPEHLGWDMCREMQDSGLVEFGSHTHDLHSGQVVNGILRLPDESREEYEARVFPDLLTSKELIQTNLGTEVTFFAYPHGLRDDWGEEFVEATFASTAITQHGPASIKRNLYDFPRMNITVNNPASKYLP